MSDKVTWAEALSAVGAIVTPLVVAVLGYMVSRRLKRMEDEQRRDHVLTEARLRYYREIAEPANDLLCWFTFIGAWKELTPPQVVQVKRSLDRTFHTLAPFFGPEVTSSYREFMDRLFRPFGAWGADALFRTTALRRREVAQQWDDRWDGMFEYADDRGVPPAELEGIKIAYNELVARLVGDIRLLASRTDYANARVVLNA